MRYNAQSPKFQTIDQAIAYYLHCNPARQKSINFFEPDRIKKNSAPQFSGNHPHDIFAIITIAINAELSKSSKIEKFIFEKYYYERVGATDIAQLAQISRQSVHNKIKKIRKSIENRLISKNILPRPANNDCDA